MWDDPVSGDRPVARDRGHVNFEAHALVRCGVRLARELDFVSVHIYPVWEGKTIDEAMAYGIANMEAVRKTLKKGDTVSLVGFGSFSVSKRAARTGRNPRTGVSVDVNEKSVPFFKAGKELRDRVDVARK